ncbi:MAG: type II toxin-antitoxin system PemK/MazF family toxin [Candidatus Gracilibacteria bacterium]|nr:type II toxin-antitoxin system PemK/MazF family toxin [Candidatus Gracilibacteria bacterium]
MRDKFNNWNDLKQELQNKNQNYKFKEGDIWWVSIGQNIKSESFGKGDNFRRPVLILKKLSSDSAICIPLSSQKKEGTWFTECILHDIERTALLYQIKMIHSNRFQRKLGQIDDKNFGEIKKRLKLLLNL